MAIWTWRRLLASVLGLSALGCTAADLPAGECAVDADCVTGLKCYEGRFCVAATVADTPVVIRFKGVVPSWILIPHVIVMFLAMLFSTLAGLAAFGKAKEFPYAATTYRLVEHFHYWTKHCRINAALQPQQFVEIDEELAAEKGIRNGDRVAVRSSRGRIEAMAVVTKRLQPLMVNGKKLHHVGIPIHWGFKGVAKPGYLTNTLTPFVGDANTQTPEFKSFLVNIEKA